MKHAVKHILDTCLKDENPQSFLHLPQMISLVKNNSDALDELALALHNMQQPGTEQYKYFRRRAADLHEEQTQTVTNISLLNLGLLTYAISGKNDVFTSIVLALAFTILLHRYARDVDSRWMDATSSSPLFNDIKRTLSERVRQTLVHVETYRAEYAANHPYAHEEEIKKTILYLIGISYPLYKNKSVELCNKAKDFLKTNSETCLLPRITAENFSMVKYAMHLEGSNGVSHTQVDRFTPLKTAIFFGSYLGFFAHSTFPGTSDHFERGMVAGAILGVTKGKRELDAMKERNSLEKEFHQQAIPLLTELANTKVDIIKEKRPQF